MKTEILLPSSLVPRHERKMVGTTEGVPPELSYGRRKLFKGVGKNLTNFFSRIPRESAGLKLICSYFYHIRTYNSAAGETVSNSPWKHAIFTELEENMYSTVMLNKIHVKKFLGGCSPEVGYRGIFYGGRRYFFSSQVQLLSLPMECCSMWTVFG